MSLISANSVLAYPHLGEEGLCVKGGIYTSDKCPICGKTLRDNKRNAVTCPDHPDVRASRLRIKFGSVRLRFKSYEKASRFLTGFRYKTDEETYDENDYKSFLRYLDTSDEQSRKLYQDAVPKRTSNVVEFRKVKENERN